MGDVPFHEVYITPKILDGYGETMSKSKGNGVDPLDVIDKFGADALRFGIAYLTTDTQDVKLPVEFECPHCQALIRRRRRRTAQLPRIECEKCGKPFSTQWAEKPEDKALPRGAVVERAVRARPQLLQQAVERRPLLADQPRRLSRPAPVADKDLLLEDRWLLSRLATVTQQVTDALEHYRYADAARTLYDFAWNEFCSFYVEMTKARFAVPKQRADGPARAGPRARRAAAAAAPDDAVSDGGSVAAAGAGGARSRGLPQPRERTAADRRRASASRRGRSPTPTRQDADDRRAVRRFPGGARRRPRNPPAPEHPAQGGTRVHRPLRRGHGQAAANRCSRTSRKWPAPRPPPGARRPTAPDVAASVTLTGQHGPIEVHVDVSRFIDVAAERKRLEKERDNLTKQIAVDRRASWPTRTSSTKPRPKSSSNSATSWPSCAANSRPSKRR